MPIRWRLAGGSAVLTFAILASFAVVVGDLTDRQVRTQFNNEVSAAADALQGKLNKHLRFAGRALVGCETYVHLNEYALSNQAQIRIFDAYTGQLMCTQDEVKIRGVTRPDFNGGFQSAPSITNGSYAQDGYRIAVRTLSAQPIGELQLLYARPLSDVEHTIARVQLFLLLGVLGGTVLALLAGLLSAQRAMAPVAELTDAAREIERTRNPSLRLPRPEADDEVAELARTLEGMLAALDAAREETEAMLERQREFVADASHELRTPLTSVLANLELLTDELRGEQADSAHAALRSTRRMRRLVGDLLLLARADARRAPPRKPTNLGDILTDAAAELGPMADEHELSLDPAPAPVAGSRDDLHRLALNLLENAVRHTPPGTRITAATASDGDHATLMVEDGGPGIPLEIERRVFDRFVRGGGDGARGSGLGLAIVRAVAESHGGTVALSTAAGGRGSRFLVTLPALAQDSAPVDGDQTSTTTGSTIGRRRSRS